MTDFCYWQIAMDFTWNQFLREFKLTLVKISSQTVWKLRKSSLTLSWQKFRESSRFTREKLLKSWFHEIFLVRENFSFFHTVLLYPFNLRSNTKWYLDNLKLQFTLTIFFRKNYVKSEIFFFSKWFSIVRNWFHVRFAKKSCQNLFQFHEKNSSRLTAKWKMYLTEEKFRQINYLVFSNFTKFLPKMRESEFPEFPHSGTRFFVFSHL